MYKAANRECVGRSHARASGRRPGRRRILTCFRCVVTRDRSPLPAAWELRATLVGAGVALDLALRGAFRRAQGHRLGAVRDGAACEPARWRTTTQKELEQRGRTGTSRSPDRPCTGCCRTPTRDGSRMRRAAAGRQRGRRQAHRRGSLRDGLAGRYSVLNCHDGEIAAVHAALETAPVAGRLLTLDALHTTREADRRDPSRGLMVKGNAPANNAITLAIAVIIHNKRKLRKPFNSFVDATMATSASRSCTQSQDPADRASLPDRNRRLSSPAGLSLAPDTPTNRAPRRNSASANLKIAASNASTRAAIRTPITSTSMRSP